MRSLPPIHNTRSPQQWDIISKHVDFKDKSVLDLGCGYGDILFRCWQAGARCKGLESDINVFNDVISRSPDYDIILLHWDLEDYIKDNPKRYDITICFSVLPYLRQPFSVLEWMQSQSKVSLIECQYAGDGPGFGMIQNDENMADWLRLAGWQSVEPIGYTMVKEGRFKRTIWCCR